VKISIGRPLPNNKIYILDEYGKSVPVGVYGELYIGGVQVAKGYWKRPELTAERFVKDPFSNMPDARMYKTGDRARFLEDGNIEYAGRFDFQVKLRGQRIELGEIESVLLESAKVTQAAVVLKKSADNQSGHLVAYVVSNVKEDLSKELSEQLRKKLPEYMVPSAFIALEEMPTITSGKVDRKSLMNRADAIVLSKRDYVDPVGDVEVTVAKVWEEVLKVSPIGREDNFFSLGGHSLLAMQMMSRLRNVIQVDITLNSIFQYSTLKSFSEQCAGNKGSTSALPSKIKKVARG
jgi:long-subunit acyl-CoA synthetase (AMP-forming)